MDLDENDGFLLVARVIRQGSHFILPLSLEVTEFHAQGASHKP